MTDSTGHYSLPGVPTGTYTVTFSDCTGGQHLQQYFNGQSDPAATTAVAVTAGSSTTGINATLASGGAIKFVGRAARPDPASALAGEGIASA